MSAPEQDQRPVDEPRLTDPDNEHRLADSGDEPSATERALLDDHNLPATPDVLTALRAGWDQGVADRAQRAHRERLTTAALAQARYEWIHGTGWPTLAPRVRERWLRQTDDLLTRAREIATARAGTAVPE